MRVFGESGNGGVGLQASDGRTPGARGLATRERLLARVGEALTTAPYRDLRVTDIARAADTSPATFYQYFLDVDAAVLVLAERTADVGAGLADLIEGRPWQGPAGRASAQRLVDGFLALWRDRQPVLRVMDLLTEEGDTRFREARVRMLNAVTRALAAAVDTARAGTAPADAAVDAAAGEPADAAVGAAVDAAVDSMAMAGALVSMLAHVAAHQAGFEAWDIQMGGVREAMTRLVYWGVNEPPLPGGAQPD